ncbi:MAG: hypothetical protein PVF58_09000 [Candidatus Methanofastidiosia archaeon]|jgi:hypothetical protein
MVKVKKKKKKIRKEAPISSMFSQGGMKMLVLGGVAAIFYYTIYLLVSVEAQLEDVSLILVKNTSYGLGMLFLVFGIVFVSYHFLKEKEFFKIYGGACLISAALLTLPSVIHSQYEAGVFLKGQEITLKSFLTSHFFTFMTNTGKAYFLVGALFLGIYLWGYRKKRLWAAAVFIAGAITLCIALVISFYNTYEMYKTFLEMYSTSKDLIISRFLFPNLLNDSSRLLVMLGVFLFPASYIGKRYVLRKWTGRVWTFGGIAGAFRGFLRLGIDSEMIHNEIVSVRQSIMQLTPYSTSFKEYPLTIETLKEFYVKKMLPVYLEHTFVIAIFIGIALLGIYLWARE